MSSITAVAGSFDDSSASDEALVARVIAGDTATFGTLMRRHNRRVFRAMRAILKDDDAAEDAMQEAYVSAYAHLSEFGSRARFSTWLVRIAVYEALRRLRRDQRFTSLASIEDEPVAPSKTPEQALRDTELRAALEQAVDALPVVYRAVFVMRSVEGLDVTETAESLDVSEETVRTRHHRARQLLQQRLRDRSDAVAPDAFGFHLTRCDRVVDAVLARLRRRDD